ncbi:MAG: hypothetical protein O2856_08830, partial [Planctomycetota bacterium]|nr:hypothetical protein [Planctomycetota bacterium]
MGEIPILRRTLGLVLRHIRKVGHMKGHPARDAVPSSLDHRLNGKGRSNTITVRPTASHSGFSAMFAKRHETNRLEQSRVRRGG